MLERPNRLHRSKRIIRFECDAALRAGEARCVRGARSGWLISGRVSQNVPKCPIWNGCYLRSDLWRPAEAVRLGNTKLLLRRAREEKKPLLARRANTRALG